MARLRDINPKKLLVQAARRCNGRLAHEGRDQSIPFLEDGVRGSNTSVDPSVGVGLDQRQRALIQVTFAREEGEVAPPSPPLCPNMVAQRDRLGVRVVAKKRDDAGPEADRRRSLGLFPVDQTEDVGSDPFGRLAEQQPKLYSALDQMLS